MSLNKLQQQVYNRIVIDKAPITYLVGKAGTGKSYTVSEIVKSVNSILTATSHQAKSILSQITGFKAHTVHKYFGYILTNKNYKQILVKKDNFSQDVTDLLVIDEVSMLPNRILSEALAGVGVYYSQILFVGDPIQLPSVSNPPNLKKLEKYKVELTQQMRQEDCPVLSSYLNSFRIAIENKTMPTSLFTDAKDITLVDSHKEFCRIYNTTDDNKRIIAYRNNIVDKYNQNIVEGSTFNELDTVILDKPIQGIANNQDVVMITAVQEFEHFYQLDIITNSGREATIRHYKRVSYLNELLDKFRREDNEDGYWNLFNQSFRLKHVYASTIHKAQGISTDIVFLDALDFINAFQAKKTRYNNPISQDMFLRLMYVGISRMKKHCYIYTGNDNKGRSYEILKESPEQSAHNLYRKKPKPKPKPTTVDLGL